MTTQKLAAPCADCGGRVLARQVWYRNAAGQRICVVCYLRHDLDVGDIVAATLQRFRAVSS
jgi:hypothetical protein